MKLFAIILALVTITLVGGIGVWASLLAGMWIGTIVIAAGMFYMQGQLFEAIVAVIELQERRQATKAR